MAKLSRLSFIGADGSETLLIDSKTGGQPQPFSTAFVPFGFNRGATWVTRDGSSGVFTSTSDLHDGAIEALNCSVSPWGASGTFVTRDGTKYVFNNGYATSIADRNGNVVTFNYSGGSTNANASAFTGITDAVGRTYTVQQTLRDPASGRFYDQISYPGASGTTRQIKIFYDQLSNVLRADQSLQYINTLWPGVQMISQVNYQFGGSNTPIVSEIDLPDGSSYVFKRDSYGNIVSFRQACMKEG